MDNVELGMNNEKLKELYFRMFSEVISKKDSFWEKDICLFFPNKGIQYDNQFLFVGRAVNGWDYFTNTEEVNAIESMEKQFNDYYGIDNLQWVTDQYGVIKKDSYNTLRSAFWRVIKKVTDSIYRQDVSSINKIVWNNLYKISNKAGWNPSWQLIDVQYELCKQILETEIEMYNPRNIIFFTGIKDWAEYFINNEDFLDKKEQPDYLIDFVGTHKNSGRKYIVAKHPMRKPEEIMTENLLKHIIVKE